MAGRRFEDKVVFITGVARGQGRSHAVGMAAEGASIIGVDVCHDIASVGYPLANPEDMTQTVAMVEAVGGKILASQTDVRDAEGLKRVAQEGLELYGHIDVVLANAGVMAMVGEGSTTRAAWDDSIDIMLSGVYNTIEATYPAMVEQGAGGAIVITSSIAGLKGAANQMDGLSPGFFAYTAAKHGVIGLMKLYSNALAPHMIRVNTVHPTGVATPMIMNDAFANWDCPALAEMQNALPIPAVEPQDITNAMMYLCSDEGRYVTGTEFRVDAGFSTR